MRKTLIIAAAFTFTLAACNSNQTSYSDKEKDSIDQLDKDVSDSLFKQLENQTPSADVAPAAGQGEVIEVFETPTIQAQPEQPPQHPGPVQPPTQPNKK
jgi:uncharacterized lipoprotein YmbA